jgi:aminoglycoside/choline kinase family phosphotransferase
MDQSFTPFLQDYFKSPHFNVSQLAGDASNRKYFRVIKDETSVVLMQWEPFDPKNYPFLSVQEHFLKHSVQVPRVLSLNPMKGLVLLEDLGDLTLERKFWETQNHEASVEFYRMALDELIKIHFACSQDKTDCTAFKIEFDVEKLLWELNYGRDNLLLGVCGFKLDEKSKNELNKIFISICETLHNQPKFIAHRDYHSRNLMIKYGKMRVIDFQDARMGPIQYDLVSLLKDSYVQIPDDMSEQLIKYYLDRAQNELSFKLSKDEFTQIYELQSIQRCFKACGSFSSFFHLRSDRRYLKYIHGTLKRVKSSLDHFPEYKFFETVLNDSGAFTKPYETL